MKHVKGVDYLIKYEYFTNLKYDGGYENINQNEYWNELNEDFHPAKLQKIKKIFH